MSTRPRVVMSVALLLGAIAVFGGWFFTNYERVTYVRASLAPSHPDDPYHATRKLFQAMHPAHAKPADPAPQKSDVAAIRFVGDAADMRSEQRNWEDFVNSGGHLVVTPEVFLKVAPEFARKILAPEAEKKAAEPGDKAHGTPRPKPDSEPIEDRPCEKIMKEELPEASHAYPGRTDFKMCALEQTVAPIVITPEPEWAVSSAQGHRIVRVVWGQGVVTLHNVPSIFRWIKPLMDDNALLINAALDHGRIASIEFPNRSVERLSDRVWWVLELIWIQLGLLALWVFVRSKPFGPLLPAVVLARRSMREQIRGNALFLRRHGRLTLYQALLDALQEAAARHIRDYAQLDTRARAEAIAARTGLDPAVLAADMACEPASLEDLTAWRRLEEARRMLAGKPQHPSPGRSPSPLFQGDPHASQS